MAPLLIRYFFVVSDLATISPQLLHSIRVTTIPLQPTHRALIICLVFFVATTPAEVPSSHTNSSGLHLFFISDGAESRSLCIALYTSADARTSPGEDVRLFRFPDGVR